MSLDKRAALSLCLGSALVMAGSVFVMWSRWEKLSKEKPVDLPQTFSPVGETAAARPPIVPAAAPAPSRPSADAGKTRNIRFTYRNSRPAKVEFIGSFNNWSPVPMSKGENHVWVATVPLSPGEHTYNFLVDGKPVRDPNNPRTAPEGRSLLVVTALQ